MELISLPCVEIDCVYIKGVFRRCCTERGLLSETGASGSVPLRGLFAEGGDCAGFSLRMGAEVVLVACEVWCEVD